MAYSIEFAKSVKDQLKSLTASERTVILNSIERQLLNEPLKETKNKKFLRPNPIAPRKLRIRNLRVFYEVPSDQPSIVRILAVGKKVRNQLYIGNKVIRI
jgi:mRNA-degrading endonuclease RelE of RelBE toxin-antitoxin system